MRESRYPIPNFTLCAADGDQRLLESAWRVLALVARRRLREMGISHTPVRTIFVVGGPVFNVQIEPPLKNVAENRFLSAAEDFSIVADRNGPSARGALNASEIGNAIEIISIEQRINRT